MGGVVWLWDSGVLVVECWWSTALYSDVTFWLFEVGACIFGASRKIVMLYFSFGWCWNVAIF